MNHPLFFDAEVKPETAKPASKYSPPVALHLAMVAMEQIRAVAAIHPCCLMISSVISFYPWYIGDYIIIQERGIPINIINQPGLNGMIEGFISHCSFSSMIYRS